MINKISKAELSNELERQKNEIVELKAMISASNLGSPMLSDKSSCQVVHEEIKVKPEIAKELMVDNDCVALDLPPTTGKKVKINFRIFCVLKVDKHIHKLICMI